MNTQSLLFGAFLSINVAAWWYTEMPNYFFEYERGLIEDRALTTSIESFYWWQPNIDFNDRSKEARIFGASEIDRRVKN